MSGTDCDLLLDLLTQLRLPEESTALALIYTHTFHKWQSSRAHRTLDKEAVTLAVISLAAKSSEKPRRLREILVPAYNHLNIGRPKLTYPSALYDELRASLVNAELILLRILKFELRVTTPFEYLEDVLRDYVYFSRTDKTHPEDYTAVTDSLLGIVSRGTITRALCNARITTSYTAKTIATCCIITAAQSLNMAPLGDTSVETLNKWLKDVIKEDPEDIQECIEDLSSSVRL